MAFATHSLADGAALQLVDALDRLPPALATAPPPPLPSPIATGWRGGTFLISDDPPPATNVRDSIASILSIVSIVDDPFFQRLSPSVDVHFVDGGGAAPKSDPVAPALPRHAPTAWPPPRRESLTSPTPTPWVFSILGAVWRGKTQDDPAGHLTADACAPDL